MTGVIAVHCGAGTHSSKNYNFYNALSKQACRRGTQVLRAGGSALDAVKEAVIVLENSSLTNAGYGSNLTLDGFVESDASIMDGRKLLYGGCGAIRKVKNPIALAHDICVKQGEPLPLGLIPPSLLVGNGGLKHARNSGLKVVKNVSLISTKARKQHEKYIQLLESPKSGEDQLLDTVGAVCIDDTGHVAAASSSGGLLLKRPGRVGQAALYASGVWADSYSQDEPAVAVSTTGCGEYLIRTQLAKEIATDLKSCQCATTGLYNSMTDKFINSRYLTDVSEKLAGALSVRYCKEKKEIALLYGHSTESMSLGYMKTSDIKPKAMVSQLPSELKVGFKVNVGGTYIYLNEGFSAR